METKTIVLKEFEGKRYELHLFEDHKEHWTKAKEFWFKLQTIYSGEKECFIDFADKEEIAEKVCDETLKFSSAYRYMYQHLLSAIGDYKYFILTETEI